MEGYFVRFTHLKYLMTEMERKYSFSDYILFNSPEEVIEQFGFEGGEYEVGEYADNPAYYSARGVAAILPADPEQTLWGAAVNGLCGFGVFETLEEAQEFQGEGMYKVWDDSDEDFVKVIFRGRLVYDPRVDDFGDACCFVPREIVEISNRFGVFKSIDEAREAMP